MKSRISIWNWLHKNNPQKYPLQEKENLSEYSCIQKDETIIKVGSEYIGCGGLLLSNLKAKKSSG
jgi:hypothetical protein